MRQKGKLAASFLPGFIHYPMNRLKFGLNWLDYLTLAGVGLIALIYLPFPLGYDQAFFTVGAIEMNQGELLYRDFWDLKQPGIFYFYFLAGKLFGFTELGVHGFELLYMLVLAIVLILTLRDYFEHRAIACFLPLLTVGFYYGVSEYWHLTQVEALVGLPMFLSLWFATASLQAITFRKSSYLFLSGLMGGVVLLFKLIFLLPLISFWLTTLIVLIFRNPKNYLQPSVQTSILIGSGAVIPLLIFLGYYAWSGSLSLVCQTFFVYPTRILAQSAPTNFVDFIEGLIWFLGKFFTLMILGAMAVIASLKSRKDVITLNLVFWCLFGMGSIFLQHQSLWAYKYLLLFVPLGILATKGIDILWSRVQHFDLLSSYKMRGICAILCLLVLCAPILKPMSGKAKYLMGHGLAITKEQRLEYQFAFYPLYRVFATEAAFLSQPSSLPGDIYVANNPFFYLLSGRHQAVSLNGWFALFLPEQWTQLHNELEAAKPGYIFIDKENFQIMRQRSPQLEKFLQGKYHLLRESDQGNWYILSTA